MLVPAQRGGRVRVLLVEDERTLARAIKRGPRRRGPAHRRRARRPAGLRQRARATTTSSSSTSCCRASTATTCASRCARPNVWTPVLMLSAKDGDYDQVDAFDLGADDYLVKPFSFPVLVARLRSLIRRGVVERPPILSAGDLHLDPATRAVGPWRRDRRPDPARVRTAALPDATQGSRRGQARHPAGRLGRPPRRRATTWSRSTSATCAARSTSPSAGARSRRCAAPATGSRATEGDGGARPAGMSGSGAATPRPRRVRGCARSARVRRSRRPWRWRPRCSSSRSAAVVFQRHQLTEGVRLVAEDQALDGAAASTRSAGGRTPR